MALKTLASVNTISYWNLPDTYGASDTWTTIRWGDGFQNVWGTYIWTDKEYYYYTENSKTYKLVDGEWIRHYWDGNVVLPDGFGVWTDGINIFYSDGDTQLQYVKQFNRWVDAGWNSQIYPLKAHYIWKDTNNKIYYSAQDLDNIQAIQYEYVPESKKWILGDTFAGQYFFGSDIWSWNGTIYRSYYEKQYRLANGVWQTYSWSREEIINGFHIWTDGSTLFYSYGTNQYKLVETVGEPHWEDMVWGGVTNYNGGYVWGGNGVIYQSQGNRGQYTLNRSQFSIYNNMGEGITTVSGWQPTITSTETITIVYTTYAGYNLPTNVSVDGCEYEYIVGDTTASLRLYNAYKDVTINISTTKKVYSISYNVINVEIDESSATSIDAYGTAYIYIRAISGELPTVDNIIVDNATLTSWEVDGNIGTLVISNPTDNVVISVTSVNTIIIQYETVNCVGVNNPQMLTNYVDGDNILLTFRANTGYRFKTEAGSLGGNIWLRNCSAGDVVTATETVFSFYINTLIGTNIFVGCEAHGTEYSITYNLNGVTYDKNNPSGVDESDGNTIFKFSANVGYSLTDDVRVSNANIVSWDKSTGVLILNNFTGNVVITINALKESLDSAVVLYQYYGDSDVVDKQPTEIGVLKGVFRNVVSVTTLNMLIEYDKLPDFNYVYISDFNRYYYVVNYSSINTKLWEINLSIDVLKTYKNAILKQYAFIDRNEFVNNPFIPDDKTVVQEGNIIRTISIPNNVFFDDTDGDLQYTITAFGLQEED